MCYFPARLPFRLHHTTVPIPGAGAGAGSTPPDITVFMPACSTRLPYCPVADPPHFAELHTFFPPPYTTNLFGPLTICIHIPQTKPNPFVLHHAALDGIVSLPPTSRLSTARRADGRDGPTPNPVVNLSSPFRNTAIPCTIPTCHQAS